MNHGERALDPGTAVPRRAVDPAVADLGALLLIWSLGLFALALGSLFGGWLSPFELITGLPCPLCHASTAIRQLLAGDISLALRTHPTATLAAMMSLVAIPALLARLIAARRDPRRSDSALYTTARIWIWRGFAALLLLQWSGTLWQTVAAH